MGTIDILNDSQKDKIRDHLMNKLNRINKELEPLRDASALKDGWGTSVLAKKQRKLEELSKEKFAVSQILFDDFRIEIS